MTLWERLWRLLPDRCDMAGQGCLRNGVRGNENRVWVKGAWRILCDSCHGRLYERRS